MKEPLIFAMEEIYKEYLTDESKYTGYAESISFPETEEEISYILKTMAEKQIPVTIQGGKTGIAGGAVPEGGHILNLSRMNKVLDFVQEEDGTGRIMVEPALNLMDLKKELARLSKNAPLFWPPEPTETSATAGGIAATGARGICSMLYGESSQYITSVRMVCSDGSIKTIERGKETRNGMDLLDLILGKEGITGVFSALTLKCIPKPKEIWGITFFFREKKEGVSFGDQIQKQLPQSETASIAAIEYMDRATIDQIEVRKRVMTKLKELPDIKKEFSLLYYFELHGEEEGIEELAEVLMELAAEYGSDPEEAWAVSGETEIEKMHAFRHGAAETVNLLVEEARKGEPSITKLAVDMAWRGIPFSKLMERYEKDLKEVNIEYCMFGHVLENHIHLNLLPKTKEGYCLGKEYIARWTEEMQKENGEFIFEHGIGKLKKSFLKEKLPKAYLEVCRQLKAEFDPYGICAKGNLL